MKATKLLSAREILAAMFTPRSSPYAIRNRVRIVPFKTKGNK